MSGRKNRARRRSREAVLRAVIDAAGVRPAAAARRSADQPTTAGQPAAQQNDTTHPDGDTLGHVWIKSEPDEHGAYHVYLELGEDDVIGLDVTSAYRWAREVLSAVATAEYDAAVLAQLQVMGLSMVEAVGVVMDLRNDRAPDIPIDAIPGLALVPGISHRTHLGFLSLQRHGEQIGQWDLDDARDHALAVIEAFEVTVLDSAYFRTLTGIIGIGRDEAMTMITGLVEHRPGQTKATQ